MPLYDWLCRGCGHEFEELWSDVETTPPCPHCESLKTEKMLSFAGYQMNSGGSSTRPRHAGAFKKQKAAK